jgi:hypothetical protein
LAEQYAGHGNTIAQQTTGTVKGAHGDDSLKRAENDLKTLIERFANGTSSDDLFGAINTIYRDADQDPELKSWFKQIDAYIRKCLQQQGYIMEDRATDEWNELYDRGNFLLRDRYRNHTDRIVDETKFLADQFDKDPLNKRFAESVNKLFLDLGNDENGKPTFKPHLVKDLSEVIIPGIFESVQYIPIPRIEYSDPKIDAVVENLVVESDNLMPNIFEVANDNFFRWGRKSIANKKYTSIMVSVSGIQMDLRDVSFYVKKKEGFPSVSDTGILDAFLGGTGLSFKIKLSTATGKDRQTFFKCDKVDVDVKNFDIKLKKSKHKFLFALAKPLMLRVMRPALQKVIEKTIKDKVNELDSLFYSVKQEADRAAQEVKENPDQAENIYSRYANAFQKKVMQGKQKGEEVKANTKVNMAITKEDSIFPNVHLPGGISSKATEYKALARKGDNWESPVFSLGSASISADIAAAPSVTRKDHVITDGGVRGPQNIGNSGSNANQLRDPATQANGSSLGNSSSLATGTGQGESFGKQVDSAFENGTGIGNGNGALKSVNGEVNGTGHTGTTLGSHNPVLTGSV